MTISLTTPITVPNVTRIKVLQVLLYDVPSIARILVQAMSPGATPRLKQFELVVTALQSDTLVKAAAPTTFDGDVEKGQQASVVNGYDLVEAAYRSGASRAAALRAVEQKLIDMGVFGAGLEGTVA